jgi:hypothetical protein
MLLTLDPMWLMLSVSTVAVLCYFFGAAIDALMREDGFGAFGNGLIMSGGFFLAILAANYRGYRLSELHFAVMLGLAGAFLLLTSLALLRALVKRI